MNRPCCLPSLAAPGQLQAGRGRVQSEARSHDRSVGPTAWPDLRPRPRPARLREQFSTSGCSMALIEGFRVRNYGCLRDVTVGRLSAQQDRAPLTPFTVVIGKNGAGKSTLFDAFGFVADCLATDVATACDAKQRGGFERLRSLGCTDPIRFDIYYREATGERPITYELAIDLDRTGRPYVQSELLAQRRKGQKHGRPYPFLRLEHGSGSGWAGEDAVETEGEESRARAPVTLTGLRQLGIATLGTLKEHPRIARFRNFLKGWYLSYFLS